MIAHLVRRSCWLALGVLALAAPARLRWPSRAAVTVFAAASLKNALDEVDAAYTAKTGAAVRSSYAASSALARQIEQGAPADVFISADSDWMDYLAQRKLIVGASRRDLLTNHLALIAPATSTVRLPHRKGFRWPRRWATAGWRSPDRKCRPASTAAPR